MTSPVDNAERICAAAAWLASQSAAPVAAVVELKSRFSLNALESCIAIRQARDIRLAATARDQI